MEKFKRVWRREGESLESYTARLEEAYDEFFKSKDGQEVLKQFEENIHKIYKDMERKAIARRRRKNIEAH